MRVLGLLCISFLIASCASLPEPSVLYPAQLQTCALKLTNFKQEVQQQGVQDAQLRWQPQYPHLAFDRFSLALLPELESPKDKTLWLNYVSRQAAIQRKVEFQNLPYKAGINFTAQENCAAQLTAHTLNDEQFWEQITQYPPEIPSNYQDWQRVIGLYPISQLFAAPAIDKEKTRIASDFIAPKHDYIVKYGVNDKPSLNQTTIQSWFNQANVKSDLEWPLLTDSQITQLLTYYAPEFMVELVSLDDKPGQVEYRPDGRAEVNIKEPALYVSHSYTRFHGKILLQLQYSLWFSNRTAKSSLDPYAGKFDAVLVRLTLDPQGQPYILDSIHHCGCYHMAFALNPTLKFAPKQADTEAPITWYIYPNKTANSLRITLSHGEHMLKDVHWGDSSPKARSLSLLNYDQLRSLPLAEEHNKSLFDEQGMLSDSQRLERFYLWPFGVKSPGAMRQYGHHATAFIGERHFDDAAMLEALFLPPVK